MKLKRLLVLVLALVALAMLLSACFPNPDAGLPRGVHKVYYNNGQSFYYCYEPWTGGFPTCSAYI